MTKILRCDCKNKFQDLEHGQQMRVHNKTAKEGNEKKHYYRCTVCLKERAA